MQGVRFYSRGQLCEYTGRTEEQAGALWFEFVVLSRGHRHGQKLVTAHPPQNYSAVPMPEDIGL